MEDKEKLTESELKELDERLEFDMGWNLGVGYERGRLKKLIKETLNKDNLGTKRLLEKIKGE